MYSLIAFLNLLFINRRQSQFLETSIFCLYLLILNALFIGCDLSLNDSKEEYKDKYTFHVEVKQFTGNIEYGDSTLVYVTVGEIFGQIIFHMDNATVKMDGEPIVYIQDRRLPGYTKLIYPQLAGKSEHVFSVEIEGWGKVERMITIPALIDLYGLPGSKTICIGDTLKLSVGNHDQYSYVSLYVWDNDELYDIYSFVNDSMVIVVPDGLSDNLGLLIRTEFPVNSYVIAVNNNEAMRFSYWGGIRQKYELDISD